MLVFSNQVRGWEVFEDTHFEWKWSDQVEADVEVPFFSEKVKRMEGKEITLTGHYLPLDFAENRMVISKNPYASCFFCGGDDGQESIAEIVINLNGHSFKLDQLLTIKGRLKLNKNDPEHFAFILTHAEIVSS